MTELSNNKDNQRWSKISLRLPENIFRDFRVALALSNDTAQDALYRAVLEYNASVKLPKDLTIGREE